MNHCGAKHQHHNEAADALIAAEDHQKRRAEASPSIPPKQPPLGVLSPCRHTKGQTCECGGKGYCLDIA